MKSINACRTLKQALSFSWLIVLALVSPGYTGDYYIYNDPNGQLVLSNYAPPQGSQVIKKETLAEVTEQQIVESRLREDQLALDNRLSSLEKSVSELTENLRAQAEIVDSAPEGYGDTNIAVGVTQAPLIVAKPSHKKFNRPGNFKRNLPNAPRPTGTRGAFLWRR
jgi:hypothetical protein